MSDIPLVRQYGDITVSRGDDGKVRTTTAADDTPLAELESAIGKFLDEERNGRQGS